MTAGSLEQFEAARPRLFSLAYRMLGEAVEAEDVVQEAYLRWAKAGPVATPAAWLTRVAANLCLTRLTSARARRERYTGPWLPEPVVTGLGPLETVEQRDSLRFGVLVLLERLTPAERAAFVLREGFDYSHREIAGLLGVSEANARQLYRRAREHVGEPRKRFEAPVHKEVVERLLTAMHRGDLPTLERLLAEDVVAWSDGGGKVSAARRPITGRAKVLRFLLGLARHPRLASAGFTVAPVNGEPALLVFESGALIAVMVPEFTGGRLSEIRNVLNPEKLAFAAAQLANGQAGTRHDGSRPLKPSNCSSALASSGTSTTGPKRPGSRG
ncbi:RNA polymerase sigma factor SigJ [Amycolatopsis magusensis]|uniref:RNA polymerase sigma factor SigJ n=1 Tax=Amycolatopsis magusensis TaxID=882444 RepID=UPI0024A7ABA8|nr:RNA polymerase sigma factor SigJ [Amycolatopsis magusensis]MDI5977057.1 RNA polymerase sigma factor SigJ [Amycolatopsis magusensis]